MGRRWAEQRVSQKVGTRASLKDDQRAACWEQHWVDCLASAKGPRMAVKKDDCLDGKTADEKAHPMADRWDVMRGELLAAYWAVHWAAWKDAQKDASQAERKEHC